MEADTAITHLPVTDCEFYRKHVTDRVEILQQCFSTFVRPRPGEVFLQDEGPVPTNLLVNTFPVFLSSYIKLI